MKIKQLLLITFLTCILSVFAQKIEHFKSFRDMGSERYFRFNYDNDYFAATDENYTQGYNLEIVLPILENNPINSLFFKAKESTTKYGLAIEHIGFTPNDYASKEIQIGDRPFAAAIMLKSFIIAINTKQKYRLSQSYSLGIIGPGAFGKEMQVGIHEATGNKIPQGWQHQVKNDVVLNYSLDYEKQLVNIQNVFSLQGETGVEIGTLFTNASLGLNATLGLINTAFTDSKSKKGFRVYAYAETIGHVIGYNATLQGGLLNRKSVYTINSNEIERLTATFNYGFVVQTKTLYFEYSRSAITREFETGSSAKYGGIKIGFTF
ncbi:lipid A deacylase LpxR family protein [Bizionia myxarmorum]|uniref:Lipid A deacylase LpxR family protein n=2 Tax=Bizionia myxarmorum TaxID=291186 RepID=A0A5D0RE06_9FLAO|nr:lipid A deacylase LpxR family protein [Bizionia myxarmorum]